MFLQVENKSMEDVGALSLFALTILKSVRMRMQRGLQREMHLKVIKMKSEIARN